MPGNDLLPWLISESFTIALVMLAVWLVPPSEVPQYALNFAFYYLVLTKSGSFLITRFLRSHDSLHIDTSKCSGRIIARCSDVTEE